MLDVLDKHKLIGGSKGLNTLTYLENSNEDFKIGELHNNIVVKDNTLKVNHGEDKILHLDGTLPMTNKGGENITFNATNGTSASDNSIQLGANKYYAQLTTEVVFEKNEDFTVSFDLKWIGNTRGWAISGISNDGGNPTETTGTFHMVMNDGTVFGNLRLNINGSSYSNTISSVKLNEWVNVSIVRQNNIVSVYYNGEKAFSCACNSKLTLRSGTYIGNWYTSQNSHYLNAYMRNFFILRSALPPFNSGYRISPKLSRPTKFKNAKVNWEGEGKISTYQCKKKQGIDENTVLYLKGEDFTDSSLYNKPITNVGATINSNGKVNSGIELAKTRVNIDRGMEGVDLSKDFTIDWWEYSTGATTGSGLILTRTVTNSNYARCFLIGHGGTKLYAGTSSATTSWNIFNAVDVKDKVDNVWVHWAFVKKGTKYTTYKNGVEFWTTTNSSVFGALEGDKLCLGAWIDASNVSLGYNAIIDNFRISNIARWETDFTPPEKDYELDEEIITPLEKGKTITSLPSNFQLKQEVEGEETISNVSLEMKYKLEDTSTVPKEEEDEENTVYLYNEGDECTDITGGWVSKNFFNYSGGNYAIKQGDCLDYGDNSSSSYGYGGFYTNNKIDLSQYSKMVIDWQQYSCSINKYGSGSGGAYNTLALAESSSSYYHSSSGAQGMTDLASVTSKLNNYNNNRLTTEIDLTNINVERHVCVIGMSGYINTDMCKCKTFAIWLEK